jgi:hypothetical protein
MECRLTGETEVLGENLPQRHSCPSQNPTWPDPGFEPGPPRWYLYCVDHQGSLPVRPSRQTAGWPYDARSQSTKR